MSVVELLNFDNAVFKAYLFWSAVLVLKMLIMGPLTAIQRFKTKVNLIKEKLKFFLFN